MKFLRALLFTLLFAMMSIFTTHAQTQSQFDLDLINISQDHIKNPLLEFWGYHDYQGSGNYSDTLRLRYYQPLQWDRWTGTARLDTSSVASSGSNSQNQGPQTSSQFGGGTTMLTVWGGLPDWRANLGARVIFPFGQSNQWAMGPQISTSLAPASSNKSVLADFSPLIRYLYGFDSKGNAAQNPLLRNFYAFPTLGFKLTENTQIRLWDENGVVYNTTGGGWFVPVDAMLTQRINQHFSFAIGASKQVIQTYQQYNWSLYGKVSLNF